MTLPKISSLTIDEKLKLLSGKDDWTTQDLDGKIPTLTMNDGPCGIRIPYLAADDRHENAPAIAYPAPVTVANSWNKNIAYQLGESLSDDCIDRNIDILLGPSMNIKRTPVCGRNFEYYSEDPFLAGEIAKSFIAGVQSGGVGTSAKHFCCNNLEYDRLYLSSEVDERTMREIYLASFEKAIESKPWTIMTSYNLVNGVRTSEHKKLFNVLRNDLGFDGLIVSDWQAVFNTVASVKAGLNLIMPYQSHHYDILKKAYADGLITEDEIDYNIKFLFELIEKNAEAKKSRKIKRTKQERYALAKEIESEGIVLLKNEDNILPLRKDVKVAVSGDACNDNLFGAGSAPVTPEIPIKNLSDSLKNILDPSNVTYNSVTLYKANHQGFYQQVWNMAAAVDEANRADVAIVGVGTGAYVEYEGGDRESCKLPKIYEEHILSVAKENPNTIVVIYAGSYIDMSNWIDKVKAVVFAGFGGIGMHEAVADVLTGKTSPSGKLSETFPLSQNDVPSVKIGHDKTSVRYLEGLDVGYRYFKTVGAPVQFPFGHGLSYTDFEYSNLQIEQKGKYDYKVTLSVKNAGKFDGAEVVQLYVRDPIAKVYRPYFELKGFDKKMIRAGETETYTFNLDKRSFAYYSTSYDEWTVDDGVFEIMIGASSEDIRLKQKIEIQ